LLKIKLEAPHDPQYQWQIYQFQLIGTSLSDLEAAAAVVESGAAGSGVTGLSAIISLMPLSQY
jgi:hypothetical protein